MKTKNTDVLSTLYRLFRVRGLNARRAPTRKARLRNRPTAYTTEKPNEVWTWDLTYLCPSTYTVRHYFAVLFLGDAFRKYGIRPEQLVAHSDNGACMKVAPAIVLLEKNGITFSHSCPRVSNDILYSESFFHTFKYSGDCLYPRNGFDSVEEAEQWVQSFVGHYNERNIRIVTPGQRYRSENAEVSRRRKEMMLEGAQTPRSAGLAIPCRITR